MSKLGLHYQLTPDWAKNLHPQWQKIIAPGATNLWPNTKTIGRFWVDNDSTVNNTYVAQGAAGAEAYFARCLPLYRAASWCHCFEGVNEPHPMYSWPFAQALMAFLSRYVDLMHSAGFRVAIGSFSVGWPDVGQAKMFGEAISKADYLALHEYGAPSMRDGGGFWTLRYRRTLAELEAAGIHCPPILITECGIDCGVLPNQAGKGWKTVGISREQYQEQLAWYDTELQRDPEVLCATPFTCGPTVEWKSFEVDETLAKWIVARQAVIQPGIIKEPPMVIDGRRMSADEFLAYIATVQMDITKTLYIHHTASPPSSWQGLTTLKALRAWYETKIWTDELGRRHEGWEAGPHLFVAEDGIWLFSDIAHDGVGVAGHNYQSRHIETVGDFTSTLPKGNTLSNLVTAAAAILKGAGIGVDSMKMHREDQQTQCPGNTFAAQFRPWFRDLVRDKLITLTPPPPNPTPKHALAVAVRWNIEEAVREMDANNLDAARQRLLALIEAQNGSAYRLERALEGE